ncbi:MAG: wax ester/triacylglycerol synthase family O-acyltransferase [Alphaproteobacteria bacterium]
MLQKLSGMDSTFYYMESPETPMHVAGLIILEKPEGMTGPFRETYIDAIRERAELVPMFRWHPEPSPLDIDYPVWVEESHIDWRHHVKTVELPEPKDEQALYDLCMELHIKPIDMTRPLWETYVIEGLPGNRVALYQKLHHAAIDGQAGMIIQQIMFDQTPESKPLPPKSLLAMLHFDRTTTRVSPSLGDTVVNMVQDRLSRPITKDIEQLAVAAQKGWGMMRKIQTEKISMSAPRSRFNAPVIAKRVYGAGSIPFTEMKEAGKVFGATINDVTISLCGGAIRRYLEEKNDLPEESLIAGAPIAMKQKRHSLNNVSQMNISFCTDIADPLERLEAVKISAKQGKELAAQLIETTDEMSKVGALPNIITKAALSLAKNPKIASAITPPFNMVMSNVKGERNPLYIAGCKVVTNYPISALGHGQGVNITCVSYLDQLDFGILASPNVVPDPDVLIDYILDEFKEFKALADAHKDGNAPAAKASGTKKKTVKKVAKKKTAAA